MPSDITYTLRYRTTRQLGFFDGFDELYWNVNGLGWEFATESVSARLVLPRAVPADQWRLAAYTGPEGATGRDFEVEVAGPREVVFRTTRALGAQLAHELDERQVLSVLADVKWHTYDFGNTPDHRLGNAQVEWSRAAAPGRAFLYLFYGRAWQPESSALDSFNLDVTVTPAG
mgnify:CR=1 FL=1